MYLECAGCGEGPVVLGDFNYFSKSYLELIRMGFGGLPNVSRN